MDHRSPSAFFPEQLKTIQAHIDHNLREQQAAHHQSQHEQDATRAREEAAKKNTPAQDEESRSGDDYADRIAKGVTSALRETTVQKQKQQPSGAVRISQSAVFGLQRLMDLLGLGNRCSRRCWYFVVRRVPFLGRRIVWKR